MLSVQGSVNQMLPSGPLVIASGCGPLAPGTVGTVVDTGKIVTTPPVVIWPMLPACSVKYRFLSEPTVMSRSCDWLPPAGYCWRSVPDVDITSIVFVPYAVNQRLPSGPLTIPDGSAVDGRGYSVRFPVGVILPMKLPLVLQFVNQMLPSDPTVMPFRLGPMMPPLEAPGTGYWLKAPAGVSSPIAFDPSSVHQSVPSLAVVIWSGPWPVSEPEVPMGYELYDPVVVILPMVPCADSVNASLPSAPRVMPSSPFLKKPPATGPDRGSSVIVPEGVIWPIALFSVSVK